MRLGILLIAILLLGIAAGIGIYLFNRVIDTRDEQELRPDPIVETPVINEIYLGLRERALQVTPSDLGSNARPDEPFAVVMDWNIGAGVVTLVAMETGDSSVYFSSGGGVIGGFGHDHTKKAAIDFVADAKRFPRYGTFDGTLPATEQVKFHFVQTSGTQTITTSLAELEAGISPLTQYFDEANSLIAELRETERDGDEHQQH